MANYIIIGTPLWTGRALALNLAENGHEVLGVL